MKKLYVVMLLTLQMGLAIKTNAQNIAINATGSLPDTSAMLDISSSTKGLLAPRMNTTQQNAIPLPANGLLIFNTTDNVFKVNTGTAVVPVWTPLALGSGAAVTSLNGLTAATQTFATGTAGTDFSISSSGTAHTFNLPTASASNRGALSSADWTAFNLKQGALTLTTTGTSGAATLVGNTLNIPSYNAGTTAWSLTGNAATSGSQFLGSINKVSLRMRTNNIERMVIDSVGNVGIGTTAPAEALSVTGNIALTTAGNKFIGNTGLTFEQNGDVYGTTRLSIQNRNAVNGAMFEQAGTVDLVDFVFKGLTNQRNIRYENRATYSYIGYPAPEFQIGVAGDPTLVVSDNSAAFRKGFLSIGMNNASALLHIKGGTAVAGTAPLKINAGTNLTTPEDGAVEYNGNHFYGTIGSTRYQLDQQGGGTVTSASVVNTNGFTGSVATATTTPAITLGTSISGMLKGNGAAIFAATAGTDYLTPTGSAAGLTSFPTLNQSTTGNAATVTTNANLTGPITSVGNATTITNNAVTYAKMQAMTTNKLLGSGTGTSVAEITLGTGLSFTGTTLNAATTGGTVTSTSVLSANGFSGSVATATTTPAITLGTTITGILKGNGTAISAATAGTDYLTPTGSAAGLTSFPTLNQNTTGTAANVTGTVAVVNGGTGLTTVTKGDVLYGSAANILSKLTAGTTGQFLTMAATGVPAWVANPVASNWSLTGNSGTTAGTNFIGTTDNTDFVIKTNNAEALRLVGATRLMGFNVSNPTYRLQIEDPSGPNADIAVRIYNNNNISYLPSLQLQEAAGTKAAPQPVTTGTQLGLVNLGGYDGSIWAEFNAGMTAKTTQDWSSTAHGTYLTLNTVANNTTATVERLKIDHNGNVGIGLTTPTATLHLKAGTNALNTAPLKFTSGTNLSTPEDGAVEFNGTHFYGTVGTTRYQLDQQAASSFTGSLSGDVTGTQSATVVGKINGATLGTTTATSGNILVANGSNAWTSVGMSGDITISNTGVTSLSANSVNLAGAEITGVLPFANGGHAGSAATSATTGTISVPMTSSVITISPTNNCTFNATGGMTGQIVTFVITTPNATSRTLTWGTNFKTTTTLTTGTTSGKVFTVSFVCVDGTNWYETSRTTAM